MSNVTCIHGLVDGDLCFCLAGWTGAGCDVHWTYYRGPYEALRGILLALYGTLALLFLWRFLLLTMDLLKLISRGETSRSLMSQVTILGLGALGNVFRTLSWIDFYGYHGHISWVARVVIKHFLAACYIASLQLVLRFFVSIHARVHPPSVKVKKIMDGWLVLVEIVVFMAMVLSFAGGYSEQQVDYKQDIGSNLRAVIFVVWALATSVASTLYTITVLNQVAKAPRRVAPAPTSPMRTPHDSSPVVGPAVAALVRVQST